MFPNSTGVADSHGRPRTIHRFSACSCLLALSRRGKLTSQEPSSEFLPTVFWAEGLKVIRTPVRASNARCQRWIPSARRECLDWLLIVGRPQQAGCLAQLGLQSRLPERLAVRRRDGLPPPRPRRPRRPPWPPAGGGTSTAICGIEVGTSCSGCLPARTIAARRSTRAIASTPLAT